MANPNRILDIGLSVIGGIIIALTLAVALLVLTSDGSSGFDAPSPTTTTLGGG